jgi:hypothetical protein
MGQLLEFLTAVGLGQSCPLFLPIVAAIVQIPPSKSDVTNPALLSDHFSLHIEPIQSPENGGSLFL